MVREALHLNEPTWSAAPQLDFDDARSAFAKHGSLTMLRSMGVFSLCSVKVSNHFEPHDSRHCFRDPDNLVSTQAAGLSRSYPLMTIMMS